MPDLLVEALRFGLAILAGGFIGVVTARRAFRDAQRLQSDAAAARVVAIRRALLAEVDDNIAHTGTTGAPIRVSRSAWETAREIELPIPVATKLRAAYALGEDLNSRIAIMDSYTGTPMATVSDEARRFHDGVAKSIGEDCRRFADRARDAFTEARAALLV